MPNFLFSMPRYDGYTQYYCWYFKLLTLESEFRLELKVGHACISWFIHHSPPVFSEVLACHCTALQHVGRLPN